MSFMQQLESHVGGLIRIKSELYWYGGRGWDGTPDRICLVLDATVRTPPDLAAVGASTARRRHAHLRHALDSLPADPAAALLLIDGAPHWIWVANEDVELIT